MSRNLSTYKAIIAAWKAKDIEGVLAHLHDDVVWHFAVAAEPPVVGKAGARKFMQRFGATMTEVRWRVFDYAESGERLFVEGVDEFTTADGKVVAAPYAGVLEFRDGLVIGWRDYVDVGVMAAQQAGAPISKQVAALMDRPAI
jgi:limonene-1,2-epoxide hydrolase